MEAPKVGHMGSVVSEYLNPRCPTILQLYLIQQLPLADCGVGSVPTK